MVSCLPLPRPRYRRGKDLRHDERRKGRSQELAHPTRSSVLTCNLPSALAFVKLPIEMWLEIVRLVTDTHALAQLMRVNRLFHAMTEPVLYGNVSLETDNAIVSFSQSLSWNPHRVGLVRDLTVSTLVAIPHSFATRLEPLPHWGAEGCQAILSVDYPVLRTFTSNLSASLVVPFLERHTHIKELHLVGHPISYSHTWPAHANTNHKLDLPSLRSLTCPPRFLDGSLDVPSTLTHLSLLLLDSNLFFLPTVPMASFRSHLVSLRVRVNRLSRRPQALRPVTLDDVVEGFPSLKYLQVDMDYPHHLHVEPFIHWTAKRDPERHTTAVHRLTVAWIFPYPPDRGVDLVRTAKWHQSLKETALEVLLEWEHLVERIVFKHTIIPCVSVALNEYRTGLLRTQESGMTDDYWNTV